VTLPRAAQFVADRAICEGAAPTGHRRPSTVWDGRDDCDPPICDFFQKAESDLTGTVLGVQPNPRHRFSPLPLDRMPTSVMTALALDTVVDAHQV